jgi:hypothetical protein
MGVNATKPLYIRGHYAIAPARAISHADTAKAGFQH